MSGGGNSLRAGVIKDLGLDERERDDIEKWLTGDTLGPTFAYVEAADNEIIRRRSLTHPFVCPEDGCDKAFGTQAQLTAHAIAAHTTARPFACPEVGCDAAFKRKGQLTVHATRHPQQKRMAL